MTRNIFVPETKNNCFIYDANIDIKPNLMKQSV